MPANSRLRWPELPSQVQGWAEAVLGAPIARVVHANGGFSPGTTDALFTADGRAAFLKAVHPSINAFSASLLRAEGEVLAALPAGAPVAELIDRHDERPDGWVALLLQHVEGAHPSLPWTENSIRGVLDQLHRFATRMTPAPIEGLQSVGDALADWEAFWPTLGSGGDLPPWLSTRVGRLHDLVRLAVDHLDGDTLLHLDLRADNLLLRPDGSLVIIDWPWAVRGAAWVDPTLLCIEFISSGDDSVRPDEWIDHVADQHGVPAAALVGLLVMALGFFETMTRLPPPPGLPTVRAFQRFQADALIAWLRTSRHATHLQG